MRFIRTMGVCVVAVVAVSAAALATASAAVPELGRCVLSEPKKGEFMGANCTMPNAKKAGKYNWLPGPGEKKLLEGTSGVTTLRTAKTGIECPATFFSGEYTGAKTASVTVILKGCVSMMTKQTCQSNPLKPGEIEPPTALEGELGFIVGGEKPVVGLDLKHSPSLVTFECGKAPESVLVTLEGSVIAQVNVINKMVGAFTVKYKTTAGKQVPEQFEGSAKDTLIENFVAAKTTEEAALKSTVLVENEEPLEIKAK